MIYNVTLKGHVENLTSGQGHDLIRNGHVACQSIRIVGMNTSMVFYRSSWTLSKVIAKKLLVIFYDLK